MTQYELDRIASEAADMKHHKLIANIGYAILGLTMFTLVVVAFTLLWFWLESLGG